MSDYQTRIDQIDSAVFEAKKFILRAEAWRRKLKKYPLYTYGSREGAACKRSSMELSNELVKLRKPV